MSGRERGQCVYKLADLMEVCLTINKGFFQEAPMEDLYCCDGRLLQKIVPLVLHFCLSAQLYLAAHSVAHNII